MLPVSGSALGVMVQIGHEKSLSFFGRAGPSVGREKGPVRSARAPRLITPQARLLLQLLPFRLKVRACGRTDGLHYLNSQLFAKGPKNLQAASIHYESPALTAELRARTKQTGIYRTTPRSIAQRATRAGGRVPPRRQPWAASEFLERSLRHGITCVRTPPRAAARVPVATFRTENANEWPLLNASLSVPVTVRVRFSELSSRLDQFRPKAWLPGLAFFGTLLFGSAASADTEIVISQPSNDIAYSAYSGLIYATVPSSANQNANTLLAINPLTGSLGTATPIGTGPTTVFASSDGTNLWTVVNDTTGVQRFNVPTQTADQFFSVGSPSHIGEIASIPGAPDEVIVHFDEPSVSPPVLFTGIWSNGVWLPDQVGEGVGVGGPDIFAVDPTHGTQPTA